MDRAECFYPDLDRPAYLTPNQFRDLRQAFDFACVLTSHDLGVVRAMYDRTMMDRSDRASGLKSRCPDAVHRRTRKTARTGA